MDLRWHLRQVTTAIAKSFSLSPSSPDVWLFHSAPSSSAEEPLFAHAGRLDQTTLKDVQRSAMYHSSLNKKPLHLHALELPLDLRMQATSELGLYSLCLRFFDERVREVGSCVLLLPNNSTVQDVLAEARKHLQADWGITGPTRLLEVAESRLHKVYRPEALVQHFLCYRKYNVFYHCLRVEADVENATSSNVSSLIEVFHGDRQSQQPFGQPFMMACAPGEKALSVKNRIKAKLAVPDAEFKSWRLVRVSQNGASKTHLKDDDVVVDESLEAKLCLEHAHPCPSSLSRQSRYNKPLTIK